MKKLFLVNVNKNRHNHSSFLSDLTDSVTQPHGLVVSDLVGFMWVLHRDTLHRLLLADDSMTVYIYITCKIKQLETIDRRLRP